MWDPVRPHPFVHHLMTPHGSFYAETEYSNRQWMLRPYMTTQLSPTTSKTTSLGSQTTTLQQLAQNSQKNSVKGCQLLCFSVGAFKSRLHQKSQLCSPHGSHKTPRFQPAHLQLLMTTASSRTREAFLFFTVTLSHAPPYLWVSATCNW